MANLQVLRSRNRSHLPNTALGVVVAMVEDQPDEGPNDKAVLRKST
jgi:hypothetical protein